MSLSKEQKENIRQNIAMVIFTSSDIQKTINKQNAPKRNSEENKTIELTLLGNIAIALATLAMTIVENADESLIVKPS